MKDMEPEVCQLGEFLNSFNEESDRGAALVAASMLDDRLHDILMAFLAEVPVKKSLLSGFNAPLGTFAAKTSAALALGLIQHNEYEEITIIRKIRNEFGHDWQPVSFEESIVAELCAKLPWSGPLEFKTSSSLRSRFNFAVCALLTDLLWRVRLVEKEKRITREWPNKTRMS